jgi:hypothetical protein
MLELTSTTRGFLSPRVTTVQRAAIVAPATGLQMFNTDAGGTKSTRALCGKT